jgi:hypothetical protein
MGACCESIIIPPPLPGGAGGWLALHGERLQDGSLELETRCRRLGWLGDCLIYADRPQNCRDYAPGCDTCRATVSRRRPARLAEATLAALDLP